MNQDEVHIAEAPAAVSAEEIRQRIVDYLRGTEVRRAILFGSFARGEEDAASDVDLVLIEATSRPFVERGLAHLPLFRLGVGLDLLIYTPEEYNRLLRDEIPFVEQLEREGETIYARSGG